MSTGDRFWQQLRDQTHRYFTEQELLWRLTLAPNTPMLELSGRWILDWGGAQRWLVSDESPETIFEAAAAVGGHASRYRSLDRDVQIFQPLSVPLLKIHRRLKQAFDPKGIFNPFRLYPEW